MILVVPVDVRQWKHWSKKNPDVVARRVMHAGELYGYPPDTEVRFLDSENVTRQRRGQLEKVNAAAKSRGYRVTVEVP